MNKADLLYLFCAHIDYRILEKDLQEMNTLISYWNFDHITSGNKHLALWYSWKCKTIFSESKFVIWTFCSQQLFLALSMIKLTEKDMAQIQWNIWLDWWLSTFWIVALLVVDNLLYSFPSEMLIENMLIYLRHVISPSKLRLLVT